MFKLIVCFTFVGVLLAQDTPKPVEKKEAVPMSLEDKDRIKNKQIKAYELLVRIMEEQKQLEGLNKDLEIEERTMRLKYNAPGDKYEVNKELNWIKK